jgi:signal transduction histidine kinase
VKVSYTAPGAFVHATIALSILDTRVVDAIVPLGFAVPVFYLAPVGLSMFALRASLPLWTAAISTLSIVVGTVLSPPLSSDLLPTLPMVNRGMALLALWTVAVGTRQLIVMRQRLMASVRETELAILGRDRFVAAIGHNLRHPLAVLMLEAERLRGKVDREGALSADVATSGIGRITRQTQRMNRLVTDLADVGRMQAGKTLPLSKSMVDVAELVRAVVEDQRGQSAAHELVLHVAPGPCSASVDAARIERVVDNLVSNAVKYSPRGGVVRVDVERPDGERAEVVIRVADEGIGIPDADRERVFRWFERAANVAEETPGFGIGLASARHIVELHGGAIEVTSVEGKGSVFVVRLPVGSAEVSRHLA